MNRFLRTHQAFVAGDLEALAPPSMILRLLLDAGADPNIRGINDYTALHAAVAERNIPPREMADAAGLKDIAILLGRPTR